MNVCTRENIKSQHLSRYLGEKIIKINYMK